MKNKDITYTCTACVNMNVGSMSMNVPITNLIKSIYTIIVGLFIQNQTIATVNNKWKPTNVIKHYELGVYGSHCMNEQSTTGIDLVTNKCLV